MFSKNLSFADGFDRVLYFLLMVYVYTVFSNIPEIFLQYVKKDFVFVNAVIDIWTVLVGISVFIPSCYKSSFGEGWGDASYFFSWTVEGGNRLGALTTLILAIELYLLVLTKKRKYFAYMIIPIYTLLMCGNRSYFITGVAIVVVAYYVFLDNKKLFVKTIIPVSIIGTIVVLNSALADKFLATQYNLNTSVLGKYDVISNGRFTPIVMCVRYFIESPLINKLFGNGFGFIESSIQTWSFNDIVDLGITYGILGLIVYFKCVYEMTKVLIKSQIPVYLKFLGFLAYFIPAMVGLYYRSIHAFLAIPIFYCAMLYYKTDLVVKNPKK